MDETYLPSVSDARWAISRHLGERRIDLIQDTIVEDEADVRMVLFALRIPPTSENIEYFFPVRKVQEGRCPTLELLELFSKLGQGTGKEVGV